MYRKSLCFFSWKRENRGECDISPNLYVLSFERNQDWTDDH